MEQLPRNQEIRLKEVNSKMMDRYKIQKKNRFKMVNNREPKKFNNSLHISQINSKDNPNKKVLDKDSQLLKRKTGVIAKE
jgi:hypothetical protein